MTSIRDRGLQRTFAPMQERLAQGEQLSPADVQALIQSAKDGTGVTKTEKKDLERILAEHGASMDPAARDSLASFITSQGAPPPAGGFSPLNMQISNAGLRKALTGEDGGAAILADNAVSTSEAQRLHDIVAANGIVSNVEKHDLRTLLENPSVTFNPAARAMLEQVAGAFVEPPAHEQRLGSSIQSAHVDAQKTYRSRSIAMATLEKAGVDPEVTALMKRADALGASPSSDGRVSIDELVALEQQGALLPAEVAMLSKVWKLMEVTDLAPPAALDSLSPLVAEDLSVRPGTLDVQNALVDVTALPASLQTLAQRAVLIADGNGADLTKVSLAKVQLAIDNNPQASTPDDRAAMAAQLIPVLQPLAVAVSAPALKAAARLPDLGVHKQTLVDTGALKLALNTETSLGGRVFERSSSWSPAVQSHQRGSEAHYPAGIPKYWDVDLKLDRRSNLEIDVPPGHKLVLVGKDQNEGRDYVFEAGTAQIGNDMVAGDYRAMLMKDGEILQSSALRLGAAAPKATDVSNLYGYELATESGQSVHLGITDPNNTSDGWAQTIVPLFGVSANNLPSSQTPVTLEPGRYEGNIATGYNSGARFVLDVLPGSNLEVKVGDQTARLFPVDEAPSTRYVGHLNDEGTAHTVIEFNPGANSLQIIQEKMGTWHGSTAWHADVRREPQSPITIDPSMRTG